jgi:phenylalanyl-tRNA synthetase beta chain
VRRALASLGYQETINFSFVEARWEHELSGNPHPVKLLNPIASQMSVMRSSLLGSLVQVLKFNLDRKAGRVNVFEIGRVFLRNAGSVNTDTTVAGFDQPMRVAGLAYGPRAGVHWDGADKPVDFYDVKGDVEALLAPLKAVFTPAEHPALHPGRSAAVWVAGQQIGHVGELHPQWRQGYDLPHAPLVFELALDAVLVRQVPSFRAVSKLQPVERDIAVIVPEKTTHAALMSAIAGADSGGLLREARLFDVYRPQQATAAMHMGEKSMAVRLVLSSDTATLTEEDIEATVRSVLGNLQGALNARVRT